MNRARRTLVVALLALLPLSLGACSALDLRGGPELTGSDVIVLTHPQRMPDGYFGEEIVMITEDTISSRYVLPDGSELYDVEQELAPADRERLVEATEEYLAWEPSVPEEDRIECIDAPVQTVEVYGSLTHTSSMQDCTPETPLRELNIVASDVEGELIGALARPFHDWTVEVRPWADGGPDESAPVESYTVTGDGIVGGMVMSSQNAPEGWADSFEAIENPYDPTAAPRLIVPWDVSGPVLSDLDRVLLTDTVPTCDEPAGEIRALRLHQYEEPTVAATRPLCPGEPAADLVERLRGV